MTVSAYLSPLLHPTGLPGVSVLYAAALASLGLYWLWRVGRETRHKRLPTAAWWVIPALFALLFARSQELPALFGIGLSLLLLAEYWPHSYQLGKRRPSAGWGWGMLLAGLGCLGLFVSGGAEIALLMALALFLAGTAALLTAALWPRPRRARTQPQGFALRWQPAAVPEWPEFSLTLTEQGAQLTNTSPEPLKLAGWSPRSINAWLPARSNDGRKVEILQSGQSAFLPLNSAETGLRVWYTAENVPQPRLFRADWVPQRNPSVSRTLN